MGDILKEVFELQPDSLLIFAGVLFLGLAVVGDISGRIQPGKPGRILAGLAGAAMLVGGLKIHLAHPAPPLANPQQASTATGSTAQVFFLPSLAKGQPSENGSENPCGLVFDTKRDSALGGGERLLVLLPSSGDGQQPATRAAVGKVYALALE